MLNTLSRLGPYEIIAQLGKGGMGEVYRARDTRLGREVAVKVLPPVYAGNPDYLARFDREVRAIAALSHPNILSIHDYGTHESTIYAVMELLEGQTLRSRLKQSSIPWKEAIDIGVSIAEGLAAAHAKGIVHRDLKPENLFLTSDARVKILDFGLARIVPVNNSPSETTPYHSAETSEGTVLGTVGYMSPEQVRAQASDSRSDIFSFGCVLYEMVTGQRAFLKETAADTMSAILRDEPPDPSYSNNTIPPELGRLIRQCLAKNPNQRLQSARDVALGMRSIANHSPVLATPKNEVCKLQAVAVLPFENVGGAPATEYLSDGLADHIIFSLSQVRREGLKVRPFSSVSRYRHHITALPAIAHELKANMFVIGRLHLNGDDLWVSVALVDGVEDNHLWGKRYQGKLTSILDLQDQIARDVSANLHLQLTGEEDLLLTKRHTADPNAYLFYTEGNYHWNKFTEEGLSTAIEYYERAIKLDPHYALAYVGLAQCHVLLGNLYRGPINTFAHARKNAEKALAIDSNLQSAHTFLGAVYLFHDWNWSEARAELKKGTEINPHASSLTLYGFCLAALGQLPEALDCLRRGQEFDPLAAAHRHELAMIHNWLEQYDQAIVEAEKAFELDPNFPMTYAELGLAYVQKGMTEQAIVRLQAALDQGQKQSGVRGMLGYAHAVAGNRTEAIKIAEQLMACSTQQFGFAFHVARIHAALGSIDQAIVWLHKACDERTPFIIWINVDPTLKCLHSDPRFQGIVKAMGLPVSTR